MAAWSTCPSCGAAVRAARLDAHIERVHPHGATTAAARARVEQHRRVSKKAGWAAVAVLVVAAAILLAVLLPRLGERAPVVLSADGEPAWGRSNATLDVFLFADYQCPYCRSFELEGGLDHVLTTWVGAGQVRLVFKDLAFIDHDSVTAAEASQAVWALAPGNWSDWNRFVYGHQGAERSGWAGESNLVALARAWGKVPMEGFTAALHDHRYQSEVEADAKEAHRAGVTGTPTIVVGTQRVNALDSKAVDAAIRDALGAAGGTP